METTVLTKTEALKKKAKGKKGFTLVELVIVIAVLAIIAIIAIPTISNVVGNANKSADASNAQSLEVILKSAAAQVQAGTQPSTIVYNSKVSAVLAAYGSNGIPPIKEGTGYKFVYVKNGGISVATTGSELTADTTLDSVYTDN